MARLISAEAVAEAVLVIARASGHRSITARSLAAELHVSLGALYNYTSSMRSALLDADRLVYTQLLETTRSQRPMDRLRSQVQSNDRELQLVVDSRRDHAQMPTELVEALETATALPLSDDRIMEIVRSYAGIVRLQAINRTDLREKIATLRTALSRLDARRADRGPNPPVSLDELRSSCRNALSDEAAATEGSAVTARIPTTLRSESCDLLLENEPNSWSFRRLQEVSGVPLARLNRTAARRGHLTAATVDLINASASALLTNGSASAAAGAEARSRVPMVMCAYPYAFIEPQSDTLEIASFARALFDDVTVDGEQAADDTADTGDLDGALVYAICHAGWRNRERDASSWDDAPLLASLTMEEMQAARA